jgi:RHS repeat-associated protein
MAKLKLSFSTGFRMLATEATPRPLAAENAGSISCKRAQNRAALLVLLCLVVTWLVPTSGYANPDTCIEQGGTAYCVAPETGPYLYQVSGSGYGAVQGPTEAGTIAAYYPFTVQNLGSCTLNVTNNLPPYPVPAAGSGSASAGNYTQALNYGNGQYWQMNWTLSVEASSTRIPLVYSGTRYPSTHCVSSFGPFGAYVNRTRTVQCPGAYSGPYRPNTTSPANAYCYRATSAAVPAKNLGKQDLIGDPVNPYNGNNFQTETDYVGQGAMPLKFVRYYNSLMVTSGIPKMGIQSALGPNWNSSYDRHIGFVSSAYPTAYVYRPDGKTVSFKQTAGQFVAEADIADRLVQLVDGSGNITGWKYTIADNDEVETYNADGTLASLTSRAGLTQTMTYDGNDRLWVVTDAFGRTLTFAYNASGQLINMTDPAGHVTTYTYNTFSNVTSVTYPDNAIRTYVYNEGTYTGNLNLPGAVTGLVDENNSRFGTYHYDGSVRTTLSTLAGGVSQYSFSFGFNQTTVTDPLGTARIFSYSTVLGVSKNTALNTPCISGCAGNQAATTYDANGNVASRTDFNGNATHYLYDLVRNLETSRTEAYGTPQARTITTQWDTSWHLPDLITEPNRTTGFTYDTLGDVLTKAITDTTVTPNVTRTWTYTYDSYGRMLTADGPRTDVADTTTYSYYTCTTGFQCGQVQTITDALGHITTFNTYNAHGQPLTVTDPNGVVTTLTYDLRLRLTSRQTGSETTSYSYYPTGLLQTVTSPDTSTVTYTYDGAHRLTDITDGLGNHIHYTLDNIGNRTAENTYDPSSTLKRTHTRVINALNELYQDVNAAGTAAVTTTSGYDNNGNVTSSSAPLARNTANQYDALNRLKQITDPNAGITKFTYDGNDNLQTVIDPRNLTTSYTHDGFDDVTQLVSPDTGTSLRTYDSGGNLKTTTDARGAVATYGYDALNRVTQVAYTDQTINFSYDAGTNGVGRLTGASDANHSVSWTYDGLGRVTGKGQVNGVIAQSVGYGYTNGDLVSLVTPSGQTVTYGYTNHRITSVLVNGTTILSGATYDPFGPANAWTWGNATTVSRTFDQDGNPSQFITAGITNGYTIDNASRITAISDSGLASNSWTFGYDLLDRVNSGTSSAITEGYTYDANSNRLTTTGAVPSGETIASTSNRLNSTTGSIARTYSYDAAGNTQSYASNTYSFNQRGRMTEVLVGTNETDYVYNALGQLIRKSGAGGTTLLMYDEAGHLLGEYDGTGALIQETVWMGDTPVATLQPNGSGISIYYVHADHLGTPRKITRPSDNGLMWRWDPDTFGSVNPNTNPAGLGAFNYNLRFSGQYSLNESGLYYNYFRDYDPTMGRYIESDPIGLRAGINPYAYVGARPISYTDPFGLYPALLVTLPNGSQYFAMTTVKNGAQAASYGLHVGSAAAIAVPAAQDPQAEVNYWQNTALKGLAPFLIYWRPGGPHDYKIIDPMFDAYGNSQFGATGAAAGFSCQTLTGVGDAAHHGHNNPINTNDIESGFNAIRNGGRLSVMDYLPPSTQIGPPY